MSTNTSLRSVYIIALIGGVLVLLFFILKPFIVLLILALVSATILNPLYRKILSKFNNRETLAAGITLVIVIVGISIPLFFLATQLFHEALQVYTFLSDQSSRQHIVTLFMDEISKIAEYFIPDSEVKFEILSYNIDEYLKKSILWIVNNLGFALSSVSTFLLDVLIFLIALYYCIKDGYALKKVVHVNKPSWQELY